MLLLLLQVPRVELGRIYLVTAIGQGAVGTLVHCREVTCDAGRSIFPSLQLQGLLQILHARIDFILIGKLGLCCALLR